MSEHEELNYDTGSIEYRSAEFDALSGRASVTGTQYDDFKRVGTDIKKYDIPFVKSISLIEKSGKCRSCSVFQESPRFRLP